MNSRRVAPSGNLLKHGLLIQELSYTLGTAVKYQYLFQQEAYEPRCFSGNTTIRSTLL